MSNVLGTIKFLEDKIITKKGELVEIWIKSNFSSNIYIEYKGSIYNLLTNDTISETED
jgi:hypothetical protein